MALFSKVADTETQGEVYTMSLNHKALLLSGIEDPQNQDISGLLQDMLKSGYTSGAFASTTDVGFDLNALPLLTETEETEEPEPEPVRVETVVAPVVQQPEPEPEPVIEVAVIEPVVEEPEPEPEPEPDPNQVIFRVQILSSSKANSNPSVTIAGTRYSTFEYFYKGAYRVTVGQFDTVQEASAFRSKCKNSGFNQAFVAAFRGQERETDPAVFKR